MGQGNFLVHCSLLKTTQQKRFLKWSFCTSHCKREDTLADLTSGHEEEVGGLLIEQTTALMGIRLGSINTQLSALASPQVDRGGGPHVGNMSLMTGWPRGDTALDSGYCKATLGST